MPPGPATLSPANSRPMPVSLRRRDGVRWPALSSGFSRRGATLPPVAFPDLAPPPTPASAPCWGPRAGDNHPSRLGGPPAAPPAFLQHGDDRDEPLGHQGDSHPPRPVGTVPLPGAGEPGGLPG